MSGQAEELRRLALTVLAGAGPDQLGDASFVRLGGDSLRAMQLVAQAERQLAVRLDVGALLSDRPLAEVLGAATAVAPDPSRPPGSAEWQGDGAGQAGKAAFPVPVAAGTVPAGIVPAGVAPGERPSSAQRGMWINEQILGASPYHLVFTCFLDGPLDPGLLATAIGQTALRHDSLRTVFRDERGELVRQVLDGYVPGLDRRVTAGGREFADDARCVSAELGRRPFDLSASPPVRFTLLAEAGGARHALVLNAHHIVLDGWAVGLMLTEIFARYADLHEGRAPGWPAARPAREHLDWQDRLAASGELDRAAEFWRSELAGVPAVLTLPADQPAPPFRDAAGDRYPVDFGPELSGRIAARAAELGITTAAFLLGAYALTLGRLAAVTTVAVGMPVAGRPTPELAGLVAVTTNLVPVAVTIDDTASTGDYLLAVHDSLARCLARSHLPFERIVAAGRVSGTIGRHPLVQVALGVHDGLIPVHPPAGPLRVTVEEGHGGGAQFDLELFIRQASPSLAGDLEYATAVWQRAEAAAFVEALTAAAGELAGPDRELAHARCIGPAGRAALGLLCREAPAGPAATIDEVFRIRAAQRPGDLAVLDGAARLSYAELAHAAAVQAALLAQAGVTPGSVVIVTAERSAAEIVAVLGVLWAGAAYAAVEPGMPDSRVEYMIQTLRPAAAIGGGELPASCLLPRVPGYDPSWLDRRPGGLAPLPPDSARLAHVSFTSGSTGRPKGVCIPHGGVVRLARGLGEYCPAGPGDRMLRFAPLSFDAATLEIWGALLTGAALVVLPPGVPSPAQLGEFIQDRAVTVAWLTAGVFRLVADYAADRLSGMRVLMTGGDVVPPEQARRVLDLHPGLTLLNGYGPTENTVFTTVHRLSGPAEVQDPLPIGTPVAGTQVYVLDPGRRLLPPGAIGELYAAGDGLADGYYGDPAQTARSFGELSPDVGARLYRTGDLVRLGTDGRLRFLGRADDQVKIRGFRVEPGEIRHALLAHPGVADAFVTVTGEGAAKQLVAGCVPGGRELTVASLVSFLVARLPGYMVPGLWAVVPELPVTQNGKVDRRALASAAVPAAGHPAAPTAAT